MKISKISLWVLSGLGITLLSCNTKVYEYSVRSKEFSVQVVTNGVSYHLTDSSLHIDNRKNNYHLLLRSNVRIQGSGPMRPTSNVDFYGSVERKSWDSVTYTTNVSYRKDTVDECRITLYNNEPTLNFVQITTIDGLESFHQLLNKNIFIGEDVQTLMDFAVSLVIENKDTRSRSLMENLKVDYSYSEAKIYFGKNTLDISTKESFEMVNLALGNLMSNTMQELLVKAGVIQLP